MIYRQWRKLGANSYILGCQQVQVSPEGQWYLNMSRYKQRHDRLLIWHKNKIGRNANINVHSEAENTQIRSKIQNEQNRKKRQRRSNEHEIIQVQARITTSKKAQKNHDVQPITYQRPSRPLQALNLVPKHDY